MSPEYEGQFRWIPPHSKPAIEHFHELFRLSRTMAEWHMGDGDECGVIARRVLELLGEDDV